MRGRVPNRATIGTGVLHLEGVNIEREPSVICAAHNAAQCEAAHSCDTIPYYTIKEQTASLLQETVVSVPTYTSSLTLKSA